MQYISVGLKTYLTSVASEWFLDVPHFQEDREGIRTLRYHSYLSNIGS